jgi:TetR/AcrR family transcriptional regulator, transcriptional repressor for nem operon
LTKGEQTREMILQRSAQVFNRKGYFGTSLSDIMQATGLEKGGIYNYFQSKDDLALQAFDYAVDRLREEFATAIKGKFQAIQRLQAIMDVFRRMPDGYPIEGGCPVLNTTVEADYAHPALRQRARQAMQEWHDFIRRIVERGIERGEFCTHADPDAIASLIISALEGAIALTILYDDPVHMQRVVDHLDDYLASQLCS